MTISFPARRSFDLDGKGLRAVTARSVSDCQYHSALAPLAIWLRCSMVCNAKGYTFDWGAYSPSSPSSSLSSSSGSRSSGRDPRSGKAALRPAQAICARPLRYVPALANHLTLLPQITEESLVGTECVRTRISRWSPHH